jgi:hypothetical protein
MSPVRPLKHTEVFYADILLHKEFNMIALPYFGGLTG